MDLKFKKTMLLAMYMNSAHKRVLKVTPNLIINLEMFTKVIVYNFCINYVHWILWWKVNLYNNNFKFLFIYNFNIYDFQVMKMSYSIVSVLLNLGVKLAAEEWIQYK